MDCASCARTVQKAVEAVPGVASVEVRLATSRAVIELRQPDSSVLPAVRRAVRQAGYTVPDAAEPEASGSFSRRLFLILGLVFGVVLFVAVAGEWLGLFASIQRLLPLPVGLAFVAIIAWPVFETVIRAALQGRIISHTLMAVGALAALVIGEWTTAAVVVFFMRVGDYVEKATTERVRRSVRSLSELAPRTARLWREGKETVVPVDTLKPGDIVLVRPGERIPVDGEVVDGMATVDQSTLTGESIPAEVQPGSTVYAASTARLGHLHIRADGIGDDTAFGRVIRLVEEAEAHRGDVQRLADRFSAYYLPVVAIVAVLTYTFRQDVMATVAVLVVACSCAFALATPVAMLASIGASARRGLLVKGGKYLEAAARADVVLVDKTGTLTLGRPRITGVFPLDGTGPDELLTWAASAERYSEHPLAEAVLRLAREKHLTPAIPEAFEARPGVGVRAVVGGRTVVVGNARALAAEALPPEYLKSGGSVLGVEVDGTLAGVLIAEDELRPDVADAVQTLKSLGILHIELLTGDLEGPAAAVAHTLGIGYQAGLLPEDKIRIVREYQARGHTVVMIGDGVNDAPALVAADVGIAMGVVGSDVAMEAANVGLLREDWSLVPDLVRIARRTMGVVKTNIGFTAAYNLVGLSLAAFGILPPILAAAAQSIPDLGIMANSGRLIRQR